MADEATVASNSSTIPTVATGRGHGRGNATTGRGGQRGYHGRNNRNQNRGSRSTTVNRSAFKGNTSDMNGHVFECYEERGDRTQFPKTLEALGEYAAKNLKHPEDLKPLFEEAMVTPSIAEPEDLPVTATKRQEVIWEAGLKSYSRRIEEMRSNLTTFFTQSYGANVARLCGQKSARSTISPQKTGTTTVCGYCRKSKVSRTNLIPNAVFSCLC
jgi:hypothetical protein